MACRKGWVWDIGSKVWENHLSSRCNFELEFKRFSKGKNISVYIEGINGHCQPELPPELVPARACTGAGARRCSWVTKPRCPAARVHNTTLSRRLDSDIAHQSSLKPYTKDIRCVSVRIMDTRCKQPGIRSSHASSSFVVTKTLFSMYVSGRRCPAMSALSTNFLISTSSASNDTTSSALQFSSR